MKRLVLVAALMLPVAAPAQVYVPGYVTKGGTYVAPHWRSRPNSTTLDNYSTRGNVNPYTGARGTVSPYPSPYAYRPPQRYTLPPVPCYFGCDDDD